MLNITRMELELIKMPPFLEDMLSLYLMMLIFNLLLINSLDKFDTYIFIHLDTKFTLPYFYIYNYYIYTHVFLFTKKYIIDMYILS